MDDCIAKGMITVAMLEAFGRRTGAVPGVERCMGGADAGRTLDDGGLPTGKPNSGLTGTKPMPASNTIYVARQEQRLFSALAQFFGPDAINNRCF